VKGLTELLVEKEIEMLKRTIQGLVRDHVTPAELSPGKYLKELPSEVVEQLQIAARKSGLQALGAKKEWGGAELSLVVRASLLEEAAQHRLGLYHPAADAFGGEFPSFLEKCSKEQIEGYVKPAIKQGKGCYMAVWEEQEDNILENLSTSAVKDADEWVINGKKAYVQNMNQSAFGVILVNCQSEDGIEQPTLFLLDQEEFFVKTETVLIDVQTTHNLQFDYFRIHDNRRIGAIGEGNILVKQWLAEVQIELAAKSIGIAVKAIEYGKQYAKLRITRGQPLAEFPSIRTMLSKAVMHIHAARLMVRDAATKVDNREHDAHLSAQMAKLLAIDTAAKIIDDVLQIHGGAGFAGDLPIERWYKEIRIARMNLQKAETIIDHVAETIL
jgi:acyl-CoA dehydrogenase